MDPMTGWLFLTRWGNAVLMFPAALGICIGLWAAGDRRTAVRWALAFGAAVVLVLATKVAFIGWGIGIRPLDFTGISGHSTLAAAVLPMFGWWLLRDRSPVVQTIAMAAGSLFALAVGVSRVSLSTHSISEVVAGLALGSLVAWSVAPRGRGARPRSLLPWALLGVLLLAGSVPGPGDSDEAHGIVVRIALALSGRGVPYTRDMLSS